MVNWHCVFLAVFTVHGEEDGGQGVNGTLVGGIVGGVLFVSIVTVVVFISIFLCYR